MGVAASHWVDAGGRAAFGLGLLLSCLALGCPADPPPEEPRDPVVAKVGTDTIRASEIALRLRRFRKEQGDLAFRSEGDRLQVRDRFLSDAIDQLLLQQVAVAHGIEVSEEEVDRALVRLRAGYPGRSFEEQLVSEGLPQSQMRRWLRKRLLIQRLLRDEVNARVAVSRTEVDSYFAAHAADYEIPERVRASQIVVRTAEEAGRIRKELLRGGKFEDLARRYSIAPEGSRGGDLGVISRGVTPNPIDSECFSLPVGRLSDVVESHYGYHLFKVAVHEKKTDAVLDSALRKKIEEELRQKKESTAQKVFLADLKKTVPVKIDAKALATLR